MAKSKTLDKTLEVAVYMEKLEHPLKLEIEELRNIIKQADPRISEQIKWNAPSYYYKEDFVTFNHRDQKQVHLVFHHKEIVNIKSDILKGDYKDRRMAYFLNMADIKNKQQELQEIIKELLKLMDK